MHDLLLFANISSNNRLGKFRNRYTVSGITVIKFRNIVLFAKSIDHLDICDNNVMNCSLVAVETLNLCSKVFEFESKLKHREENSAITSKDYLSSFASLSCHKYGR